MDTTEFNTDTTYVAAIKKGMFFATRHIVDMFLSIWPAMLPNVIIWAATGWWASRFLAQFHFNSLMGVEHHAQLYIIACGLLILWLLATAIFWGSQTYVLLYYTHHEKWPPFSIIIKDSKTLLSFIIRAILCLALVVLLGLFPSLILGFVFKLKWYWLIGCWGLSNLLLVVPLLPVYYEWVIKGNPFTESLKQIKTGCSNWGTWFTVAFSGFFVVLGLSFIFWLPSFLLIYVYHLSQLEILFGNMPDLPSYTGLLIPVSCAISTLASLALGGLLSVPLSILYGLKLKDNR